MRLPVCVLLLGGLSLFAGCKQGQGDRCEVDSDCKDGLKCSPSPVAGNGTCGTNPGQSTPDAATLVVADAALQSSDLGTTPAVDSAPEPDSSTVAAAPEAGGPADALSSPEAGAVSVAEAGAPATDAEVSAADAQSAD